MSLLQICAAVLHLVPARSGRGHVIRLAIVSPGIFRQIAMEFLKHSESRLSTVLIGCVDFEVRNPAVCLMTGE
jgi:hypothetical protein